MTKRSILAITLLSFAITSLSYSGGLFYGLESFFEDLLVSRHNIDSRILIVSIDDDSISKLGQWPWKRAILGEGAKKLGEAGAAAVAVDVVLSESSRFGTADDASFYEKLSSAKMPVILSAEMIEPEPSSSGVSARKALFPVLDTGDIPGISLGHVNIISDRDGTIRSFYPKIEYSGSAINSLAVEAVKVSGLSALPLPENKTEKIVFSGPAGTVRRIPFWRVFEGKVSPEDIKGKIVFIGATAADLHDEKPTPMGKGAYMSGVEIQAQVANMLISGYHFVPVSSIKFLLLLLFLCAIPPLFFLAASPIRAIILNLAWGIFCNIVLIVLWGKNIPVNFVHWNMAWFSSFAFVSVYQYFVTGREKRELRNMFSKYVSKDVLEEMIRDPKKVRLGGEEREVTVFFSDVRGFTTLSETMTPGQLTGFLNKYLTLMTDIVLEKKGVVDKYIGDAIMAFWGAPVENKTHALSAVLSAMEMAEALPVFNERSKSAGDPPIDIGIGLNSGTVTVGNMGSNARFDYTVMGDTVNLASRLEGQTKNYGVKIIISETTRAMITENMEREHGLLIREVDRIKVKGKKKPVTIFEVVPKAKQPAVRSFLGKFNDAREFYYAGRWSEALAETSAILSVVEDGPSKTINERCLYFIEHEPEEWEGVYEMKTK